MSGVTAKVTATAMAIKPSTCAQAIDVRFAQIAMDNDARCAPPFVTCAAKPWHKRLKWALAACDHVNHGIFAARSTIAGQRENH